MPTLKSFKGFSVCSLVWVLNKKQRMIAEGIETAAQLDLFKAQSCNVGQGFYFSQPLSSEAFSRLLENKMLTN
ncbi:MAG: EAL domain-containing protein (putative c-di-GMP-specific phosphodiesterase class I) [Glaciecola sp.]|jgi:EAL domain-containing protein (putative c-di-GMP-specific phosphodiesterase class I)